MAVRPAVSKPQSTPRTSGSRSAIALGKFKSTSSNFGPRYGDVQVTGQVGNRAVVLSERIGKTPQPILMIQEQIAMGKNGPVLSPPRALLPAERKALAGLEPKLHGSLGTDEYRLWAMARHASESLQKA